MGLVRRYAQELTKSELVPTLKGSSRPIDHLESEIDLEPLKQAIYEIDEGLTGSELDARLVEPVHSCLRDLSRREAADMRVWHWLCVDQFSDVVARRWDLGDPKELPADLPESKARRFLGKSTLVGVARNTFARLWWAAEGLGNYDAARKVTSNQEDFVAVFERSYGIYRPAAAAAVSRFSSSSLSDDDQRKAAKWLQQTIPTSVIEVMTRDEISEILDESIENITGHSG